MAIRRPPTTFSDTISTTDIADDAITGGKLANDIAISTTGNIVTTGSGALTVAGNTTLSGTNNLGSNPTVTLGTNTTFPDGTVTNLIHRKYGLSSNSDFSNTSGGASNQHRIMNRESSSSAVVPSFTAKQGHTYQISYNFYGYTDQNSGVSSSGRRTEYRLYYGTTSRSQNDATFDTLLIGLEYGRNMNGSFTSQTGSYFGVILQGAFYHSASDATIYTYFTGNATDNGKRSYAAFSASTPMHLFITEYKGNVSSTVT